MATTTRSIHWLVRLLLLLAVVAVPSASRAATYGNDVYGGGSYNVGVVPTVVTPAAPSGGGVIGGPYSVGYVNFPVVATTTAIVISSTTSVTVGAQAPVSVARTTFSRSLRLPDRHPDVKRLQAYLNAHGFVVAESGPGSRGQETENFGRLTYLALIRFQEAHAEAILKPAGLVRGTGYFGAATRAFINASQD